MWLAFINDYHDDGPTYLRPACAYLRPSETYNTKCQRIIGTSENIQSNNGLRTNLQVYEFADLRRTRKFTTANFQKICKFTTVMKTNVQIDEQLAYLQLPFEFTGFKRILGGPLFQRDGDLEVYD